jgi:hypothetical protein
MMNMSGYIAAFLNYGQSDLLEQMLKQLVDVENVIPINTKAGDKNFEAICKDHKRLHYLTTNVDLRWIDGWNNFMAGAHLCQGVSAVWMLNDDVLGVNKEAAGLLYSAIVNMQSLFAITPAFNSPHSVFNKRENTFRNSCWIDWTCPMVNNKLWSQVGGFDEDFPGYGADIDLCVRARKRGYVFMIADQVEVKHIGSVTAIRTGKQSEQGNVQEMDRLLRKKHGKPWCDLIHPTMMDF